MTPNELLMVQASHRVDVFHLWRAIYRWVFDEIRCPFSHRKEIEKEILAWNRIVNEQKRIRTEKYGPQWEDTTQEVGKRGNPVDELEYQIGMMCKILVENEQGAWNYTKDTFRIHDIDYRKSIHCKKWFPEIPTDYEKGKANLEQAKRDNPQDYKPEGK